MSRWTRESAGFWRIPLGVSLISVSVGAVLLAPRAHAAEPPGTQEVSVLATSNYGQVLVVGNGRLKGTPLYMFSGDQGGVLGCGTALASGYDLGPEPRAPLTCTGPEKDFLDGVKTDDWPAFTSARAPLAGKGVNTHLLGSIERPGIGRQVTYAGHPLYLFDAPSRPFSPQGEGYVETVAPLAPWHGYWSLVSASGTADFGRAHLSEETLPHGAHALALEMDENVMPINVSVYVEKTTGGCGARCSRNWIPVLSIGAPLARRGVATGLIGTTVLASGARQVTYRGQPLYLYSREKLFLSATNHLKNSGSAGNGNGVLAAGGPRFTTVPLA